MCSYHVTAGGGVHSNDIARLKSNCKYQKFTTHKFSTRNQFVTMKITFHKNKYPCNLPFDKKLNLESKNSM